MIYGKTNVVTKRFLAVKVAAILFKNNFDIVLNKDYVDPSGHLIF